MFLHDVCKWLIWFKIIDSSVFLNQFWISFRDSAALGVIEYLFAL